MHKIKPCLSVITALVFIAACSLTLKPQKQKYNPDTEERMKLVESNLCSEIQVEGEPNWTLEERMSFYHVNGVSIAVIKNYKIEWAKGYGWADSASHRPVTTATLFQAGSMSKSINAVGILKLAQDGKLNLYEDINTYLKTWKFPYDSLVKGKKISLANLLSHTAGLTVHGFPGYERGEAIPTLSQILDGVLPANTDAVRSAFEPSLKGEYSGGGTTISQLLVEDVTDMPYDKFMLKNVLKPMGMSNSSFTQPPLGNQNRLATGYYADGKEVKGKFHIYPEQAAAGLWTTPTDLCRYIIETQLSLKGKSRKVLAQEMTSLRLTPYKNKVFGLGVFIDKLGDQTYFSHAGQDRGFTGRYFGSFDGGNGIVVMTNTNNMAIANEIINSVAVVYQWKDFYKPFMTLKKMPLSNDILESYAGRYKVEAFSEGQYNLGPETIFTISKEGNQLKAKAAGQKAIAIYPAKQDVFFPKTSDTDIKFTRDEKAAVTHLTIHQNGKYFECKKVN